MGGAMKYIGEKYGKLTIVKEIMGIYWLNGYLIKRFQCLCECGGFKSIRYGDLRSGATQSCGCIPKGAKIKHGFAKTRIYKIWEDMNKMRAIFIFLAY